MKKILISGILGQDGSYLAEFAISLGHEVHGIARGVISETGNYVKGVTYHVADMRDELSLENVFRKVWPDEIYNLAGQVFVPTSWTQPEETFDVNVNGLARLLKIVEKLKKNTRVYQASSSEMYGNVGGALNEYSEMKPVSPYGVSKLAAHHLVQVYRNAGLFVVGGILMNHESPRRGEHMVTRKITKKVAKWALGDNETLELGNVNAARDWGHARDYCVGMYLMLQQEIPDDYVIGSGETHTVLDFIQEAVKAAGLKWSAVKSLVKANSKAFVRKGELHSLRADASKAKLLLGWTPETSFADLVKEMVLSDIESEQKRMSMEVVPRDFKQVME